MTLLHYASRTSNIDTVKYLIDAMVEEHLKKIGSKIQGSQTLMIGPEVCLPCYVNITNMRDDNGKTPLYHTAEWGSAESIDILLKHGADQRYADNNGLTAFHVAAKLGRTDVLKKLAPLNININFVDKQAKSAIFLPTQEGNKDSLQYLINLGADLTIKDSKGWSLLHAATANGHNVVVKELLRHKYFVSKINDVDKDDKPPTWYAINLGHIDILETLELKGARIRQDHLCENNNVDFVEYLTRKNGIQVVTTCFNNETTLLHLSATKGHVNLLKHLTKFSCLVNSLDKNKKSPLWYAVNLQKWDCVNVIKEAGGNIEPLVSSIDAVRYNLIGFVKYFVKEGFSFPQNSLHEAASVCHIEVVKEVVKISSLINAYDYIDKTPLWYAIKGEHWDCVDVLERAGAEASPKYSLEEAANNNLLSYVKYLIRKGANVNSS